MSTKATFDDRIHASKCVVTVSGKALWATMRLGNPAHGLNDIRQTGIELGLNNTKDNPTTQLICTNPRSLGRS